uniref:Nuclear cap-binding protein subunit 2 n=1 Tax=Chromera velia CCMP2878 TaxID=1169474 RepID=A0A0G4GLA6_9ALVE|eukprot:Cvel_685.t1-p1 / transcript=Cvel_685.t1 / gene=Cvel_685 / organism=Chromera_velia_CCMP2878 / gene_product=Nuclear cap-binding protein subunit 2, putative / transcript_product=Nuclear cap-binding protein subunit 2, putative / location=Cvel_scaffold21:85001-86892(-) / protein_length=263 / sequence_SO=supercontig / SO=protein_coding / is_pseudo=false
MAELYDARVNEARSNYYDKKSAENKYEWNDKLRDSTTVYIGNLAFDTKEEAIYEFFSSFGHIVRVVMGLNARTKEPCGFAFVQYRTHDEAHLSVALASGAKLDDREIRVDWDSGEGIDSAARKFGRGHHGIQWRDEFREEYDERRGGEGGGLNYEEENQKLRNEMRMAAAGGRTDEDVNRLKRGRSDTATGEGPGMPPLMPPPGGFNSMPPPMPFNAMPPPIAFNAMPPPTFMGGRGGFRSNGRMPSRGGGGHHRRGGVGYRD